MLAFLSKLFALFLSKIAKNVVFALCCEISIAEVRLRFNLVRKCRSAIAEVRCASTESTSSLRKLRWASKMKKFKLHILRCAFTRLKDRCAFDVMLLVSTLENFAWGDAFAALIKRIWNVDEIW